MKKFFDDWEIPEAFKDRREEWDKLCKIYIETDEQFDNRLRVKMELKTEELDRQLEEIKEKIEKCMKEESKNDFREEKIRMCYLIESNILLRRGQIIMRRGQQRWDGGREALAMLEQNYQRDRYDCITMMSGINLGKYFRNIGQHGYRSDSLRALDAFREIANSIIKGRQEGEDGLGNEDSNRNKWEIQLWLEAFMNLGCTSKNLYKLRDAKLIFLEIIRLFVREKYNKETGEDIWLPVIGVNQEKEKWENEWEERVRREFSEWYAQTIESAQQCKMQIKDSNDERETINLLGDCELMMKKVKENCSAYVDYLIQALVELGISYRKGRDYGSADIIFNMVLLLDSKNIDAANNHAICLFKRNYSSYGKNAMIEKENNKEVIDCRQAGWRDILENLEERGNRFAKITLLKYKLERGIDDDKWLPNVDKMLSENPQSYEIRLLKGLYYRKQDKLEDAKKVFGEIYKDFPYIRRGTSGLKAYYNLALATAEEGKFYEALAMYEKIISECRPKWKAGEVWKDEVGGSDGGMWDWDLPEGDLRAEIDYGWCLMNIGKYEEAKQHYHRMYCYYCRKRDVSDQNVEVKSWWGGEKNFSMLSNNLAECLMHTGEYETALKQCDQVLEFEPYNATANRIKAFCQLHLAIQVREIFTRENEDSLKNDYKDKLISSLEGAKAAFEEAILFDPGDVRIHSGWVKTMDLLLQVSEEKKNIFQKLVKHVQYSSGVYSLKACALIAALPEYGIESAERNKEFYRALARICIGKKEEGYSIFNHLINDDVFMRVDPDKRGQLLAAMFLLYDPIIDIKKICRAYQGTEKLNAVHYTKLNTLKILLNQSKEHSPKLRLWNTVNMNDPSEGEAFFELMERVYIEKKTEGTNIEEKSEEGSENRKKQARKKLEFWFPYLQHLSEADQKTDAIAVRGSTYVTSFCTLPDSIRMWIPYADDATGCAISFDDGFLDLERKESEVSLYSLYSDEDCPLYQIQYINKELLDKLSDINIRNEEGFKDSEQTSEKKERNEELVKICELLEKIWKRLYQLETTMDEVKKHIKDGKNVVDEKSLEKAVRTTVADCLNQIRFLFKSSEYDDENELRMVRNSYNPLIEYDAFDIPRTYVEIDRDIRIKEVRLGSGIDKYKADDVSNWLYSTGKVKKVSLSERHYR